MTWLSAMLHAVLGIAGFVVGMMLSLLVSRKPKPYQPPKPICGCGHHVSFHDDGGCHHINDEYRVTECGCVKYIGPEALPEYTLPADWEKQ